MIPVTPAGAALPVDGPPADAAPEAAEEAAEDVRIPAVVGGSSLYSRFCDHRTSVPGRSREESK